MPYCKKSLTVAAHLVPGCSALLLSYSTCHWRFHEHSQSDASLRTKQKAVDKPPWRSDQNESKQMQEPLWQLRFWKKRERKLVHTRCPCKMPSTLLKSVGTRLGLCQQTFNSWETWQTAQGHALACQWTRVDSINILRVRYRPQIVPNNTGCRHRGMYYSIIFHALH